MEVATWPGNKLNTSVEVLTRHYEYDEKISKHLLNG